MLEEHGIRYTFEPSLDEQLCRMMYDVIHLPSGTRISQSVLMLQPGRFAELLAIWNEKSPDVWVYAPTGVHNAT